MITEVMEPNQVDIVAEYADILQIGTRNMQNYSLLRDVGRVARPVMLKRGYGATVEEWLMAAEYIVSSGNPNVILCERGIRTFETYTRNTMDLAAVPLAHHLTHLPVIVDPSHATGKRWLVKPLAIGGVGSVPTGSWSKSIPDPTRRCRMPSSSSTSTSSAISWRPSCRSTSTSGRCASIRCGRRRRVSAVTGWPGIELVRRSQRRGRAGGRAGTVARVRGATRLRGDLRLPGDKSISHRALMLAALAAGESLIERAGDGADVRSTARIVAALGSRRWSAWQPTAEHVTYRVVSPGADGLRNPKAILDCGNSGTSLRLFSGVLAGLPMTAILDGDASLRRRPVARIIEPLRSMGAVLHARRNDSLPPLTVVGHTPLRAIDIATPVPSAQVKSAILLAGLRADGRTTVRESVATRDHTERMLRARGVPVEREDSPDGWVAWTVQGGVSVHAVEQRVPGDVSAAAFWLVAGAIHPDAELTLRDVGINPTRRAVIDILRSMGARIEEHRDGNGPDDGVGEPLADLVVRSSELRAVELGPTEVAAGDRRDPDPVPGRDRGHGNHRHPRRRRACGTRSRIESAASPRACERWAHGSRSTATTSRSKVAPACAARRPTASTTTAWR